MLFSLLVTRARILGWRVVLKWTSERLLVLALFPLFCLLAASFWAGIFSIANSPFGVAMAAIAIVFGLGWLTHARD